MARKETLLVTTAAISLEDDCSAYEDCAYYCNGLGAAETVAVQIPVNGTYVQLYDYDASGGTNVAVQFTGSGGTPANVNGMTLRGGQYKFVGADPAGTVAIERILGRHLRG